MGFVGVFKGGFGRGGWLDVVFCWTERGGMRGRRGPLTYVLQRRKTGQVLRIYFSVATEFGRLGLAWGLC